MEKNMSEVKSVVETVTTLLGYSKLKIEEKDVILSLYRGGMFSWCYQLAMERLCACLPVIYDQLKGRTGSISALTALMNDQVH